MATALDTPLAKEPFSSNPLADIIIRTSNNVNFFVVKAILSLASPVFADMFTLPHTPTADRAPSPPNSSSTPTSSVKQQIPVVAVTEDDQIIDIILRVCYPVPNPKFDLQNAMKVLEVGRKYQMEKIITYGRKAIARFVDQHLITVYGLACMFSLKEEAELAAKASRRFSMTELLRSAALSSNPMSGTAVSNLLLYHAQCCAVVTSIPKSLDYIRSAVGDTLPEKYYFPHGHPQDWLETYLTRLSVDFASRVIAWSDELENSETMIKQFLQEGKYTTCQQCYTTVFITSAYLRRHIMDAQAKVRRLRRCCNYFTYARLT